MQPLRVDVSSAQHAADPDQTYAILQAAGPVVRVRLPIFGSVWMTTTHAAAGDMLKDSGHFARDPGRAGRTMAAHFRWWMPRSLRAVADNMLMYDGEDHRRLRGAVDYAFARRDLRAQSKVIWQMARDRVDPMPTGAVFDFMSTVSRPYPLAVITDMLGLTPQGTAPAARHMEAVAKVNSAFGLLSVARNIGRMRKLLEAEVEHARADPRPGLLHDLLHPDADQPRLSHSEIVSMIFMLYFAGHETTVHLINACMVVLATDPAQQDRLRKDPDATPLFVEEVLRHRTPVQFTKPRFVTEDMEFRGVRLKKGDQILAHLGLANRDPEKYSDPDTFDPSRKPNPHLAFGAGAHFCLGVQLARLEVVTLLDLLLARGERIKLGCDATDLPWRPRIGLRSVKALPVMLDAHEG